MSERFLSDLLREAPRPRRDPWYATRWPFVALAAVCFAFAAVLGLWDGRWTAAFGWAVGGAVIYGVYGRGE